MQFVGSSEDRALALSASLGIARTHLS